MAQACQPCCLYSCVHPTTCLHATCTAAGLLEFLAYEPYYHSTVWRGLLQDLYEQQSVGGLLSLRSLLRGVMLRRSKADVGEWWASAWLRSNQCEAAGRWLPNARLPCSNSCSGSLHCNKNTCRDSEHVLAHLCTTFLTLTLCCCLPGSSVVQRTSCSCRPASERTNGWRFLQWSGCAMSRASARLWMRPTS